MTVFSHKHNVSNLLSDDLRLPPVDHLALHGKTATVPPFVTTFLHFVPLVSLFYPTPMESAIGKPKKIRFFPAFFWKKRLFAAKQKDAKKRHFGGQDTVCHPKCRPNCPYFSVIFYLSGGSSHIFVIFFRCGRLFLHHTPFTAVFKMLSGKPYKGTDGYYSG